VYHHRPVLEQGIQPPAIRRRKVLHSAAGKYPHQLVEGIREEDIQNEKECQIEHQDRDDVRHHVAEPVTVLENGHAAESRSHENPKQHGAIVGPP
jgi:hypothetical protein